jgi:hypothetical protein
VGLQDFLEGTVLLGMYGPKASFVVAKAQKIVKFIRLCHVLLVLFCKHIAI